MKNVPILQYGKVAVGKSKPHQPVDGELYYEISRGIMFLYADNKWNPISLFIDEPGQMLTQRVADYVIFSENHKEPKSARECFSMRFRYDGKRETNVVGWEQSAHMVKTDQRDLPKNWFTITTGPSRH